MQNLELLLYKPQPNTIHITLTFAQSIDGVIGRPGAQLLLSSTESMMLTHTIRNNRDAILVGIGTVKADNPSLTTRFIDGEKRNPRVVVVDKNAETPLDAKFIGRNPIIMCSYVAEPSRIKQLNALGCEVILLPLVGSHLDLVLGIQKLADLGISSVMVEGGSKIISEFLNNPQIPVHELIITISPQIIGEGVRYQTSNLRLENQRWINLGIDTILQAKVTKFISE